jgi:DNA primase
MMLADRPRISPAVIDRIRARYDISAVADRLGFATRRVGHEYVGLCPFHKERTPSWKLNDAKGFAHCFGCGANHDTIALVMSACNLPFVEALRWLDSSELPPVDPVVRQEQELATRVAKLAQVEDARRWVAESRLVQAGDPVSTYLRARGIMLLPPDTVRLAVVPKWRDPETGEWGPSFEAMLCVAQDRIGAVTGVQRVFFARNDPALGKADKPKRSWGNVRGSPLRLGPAAAHINLAEGPEDGLSAREMMPERPCWVAFGTGNMPFIGLPDCVSEVTLLGQNNEAGKVAVRKAGEALLLRGLAVRETFPPPQFDDWNDLQRGLTK